MGMAGRPWAEPLDRVRGGPLSPRDQTPAGAAVFALDRDICMCREVPVVRIGSRRSRSGGGDNGSGTELRMEPG